MSAPALTNRELGRATLARQLLLARAELSVPAAVQQLGGLQAQEPKHPFIGLWTRLAGFSAGALLEAIAAREVVRATLLRSTLHLFSATDYAALRMALQPPASVALRVLGARAQGLDPGEVIPAARELLTGRPLTFDEIRGALAERFADVNDRALGYCTRTLLALVMIPCEGRYGYPRVARFGLAEELLGAALAPAAREELDDRILGALRPASASVASPAGASGPPSSSSARPNSATRG
jgi:hypothetical protein